MAKFDGVIVKKKYKTKKIHKQEFTEINVARRTPIIFHK